MTDNIRLPQDLGKAIRKARKDARLKAGDVARQAGRSRDVLNRLERGEDVTVSSLLAILSAMGLVMRLDSAGLPTLAEMRERFADLNEDDGAA